MKARFATPATPVARSARHSTIRLAVLLSIVLIGSVLVATLYRARPAASVPAPAVTGVPAALDQYERHADRFVPKAERAALDQHERHRYGFVSSAAPHDVSWPRRAVFTATAAEAISAPLDQHERHQGAYVPAATPLDQHDRHMELFAPKAEHAALLDALDRYLAAHDR
jgi:hypothetical protein